MKKNTDTVQLGIYLDKRLSDYLVSKGNRSREIARIVTEAYKKEQREKLEKL